MGRIDLADALRSALRYQNAFDTQQLQRSDQLDARMLNKRREFMRPADRVFFESIVEGSDLLPIRYLEIGQRASRAVGRIELPSPDGRGIGFATGFLVAPRLLMTNQHVLRTADWAAAATFTLDAADSIDGVPLAPRVFKLQPTDIFVADSALDFALVSVTERSTDGTALSDFGYLRLFEQTGKIVRDEYATIIQHPNGRQKHLAARNNRIAVYVYDEMLAAKKQAENNYLYYQTDTLRGSSGSPVFSDQWYVVALHRRGVPKVRQHAGEAAVVRRDGRLANVDDDEDTIAYVSNEGVRVSRILARLEEFSLDARQPMREDAARALTVIQAAAGDVDDGPIATPVAVPTILRASPRDVLITRPGLSADAFELTHRDLSQFPDDLGYDEEFLDGFILPLPKPKAALEKALARRIDDPASHLLPFRHFTTAVHAQRRMAAFCAVNLDIARRPKGALGGRPAWSVDPRIAEEHQPDDTIFSTMLQRGHLAARDYVVWGRGATERRQADLHSFTLTNVCPQLAAFNGRNGEWFQVERNVVTGSRTEKARLTEFLGPIFRADDPSFDSLRSTRSKAERHTRIRVPLRFWKIIAWVEDGELSYRAFILDQSDELDDAGPLELDIERPDGVEDSSIEEIAELTDLEFEGFS